MVSPVLFSQEASAIEADGIQTCVEFGPGKTVSSLIRFNNPRMQAFPVGNIKTLKKFTATL